MRKALMERASKKLCRNYESCASSICPFENTYDSIWYPDEEICNRRRCDLPEWIRKQRRIKRKAISRDRYYLKDDIEQIGRVSVKTKGRNPDRDIVDHRPAQKTPVINRDPLSKPGVYDNNDVSASNLSTNEHNSVNPRLKSGIAST